MTAVTMPRGSILQIYATDPSASGGSGTAKWNKVTEHNRSEFSITPLRIEKSQRMSNGTLRNYFVADKQQISLSWIADTAVRNTDKDSQRGFDVDRKRY